MHRAMAFINPRPPGLSDWIFHAYVCVRPRQCTGSSSRIRVGDTYDGSVTIGTWLSVMSGQKMLDQSVNPSISVAAQLSIFVKGHVSVPPNPFSFSKRRDGIGLELAKFFAHGFAAITNNNCKNPYSAAQPYARTIPAFRLSFTPVCDT